MDDYVGKFILWQFDHDFLTFNNMNLTFIGCQTCEQFNKNLKCGHLEFISVEAQNLD